MKGRNGKKVGRFCTLKKGTVGEGLGCKMTGATETSEDSFFLPQLEGEGGGTPNLKKVP